MPPSLPPCLSLVILLLVGLIIASLCLPGSLTIPGICSLPFHLLGLSFSLKSTYFTLSVSSDLNYFLSNALPLHLCLKYYTFMTARFIFLPALLFLHKAQISDALYILFFYLATLCMSSILSIAGASVWGKTHTI